MKYLKYFESIRDTNSLIIGKRYKITWPNYDDYGEGLKDETTIVEVIDKNRSGYILKDIENDFQFTRRPNMLDDCQIEMIGESAYPINISKKNFPTDQYFVYRLSKKDLGNWLNVWFPGRKVLNKNGDISYDEVWTVKKVDKKTSINLYNQKYNPIGLLTIATNSGYNFKAQIFSIDDSSYSMWWKNISLSEAENLKIKLMKWVNSKDIISGSEWFKYGETLNCGEFSYD